MVRTQLMLEEGQHRRLKRLAQVRGKSLSAVLREILDEQFGMETADISGLAGMVNDSPAVAREHDRWVYGSARGEGDSGGE
jgi:hypothetical protein